MDERELIGQISRLLAPGTTADDCAVLEHMGEYLVMSTDMLHERTDFPEGMTDWQIGWMSAAVTLSDIAAMGALPAGVLIAVGLDRPVRLPSIVEGARDCCRRYGTEIAGGDIDRHDELTIVTSGIGFVEKGLIVRRSGARTGDLICVTGTLGCAEAALRGYESFQKCLFEPTPRVREGRAIAKAGATSMIDISDGLVLSLHDLCRVNDTGYHIHAALLPLPDGIPHEEALEFALHGGGDFELLFTIPEECLSALHIPYRRIGEVIADRGVFLDGRPLAARGYMHRWGN